MDRLAIMLTSLAAAAITVFGISVTSVDGINTIAISHLQFIARDDCDIVLPTALDFRTQCSYSFDASSTAGVQGSFCDSSGAKSKFDANGFQVWSGSTNANCYNLHSSTSYANNWDDMPFDAATATRSHATRTLIVHSRIFA